MGHRSKPQRLADLVVKKLGIQGGRAARKAVRDRLISKQENDHFSLPETLDLMCWAAKVNRLERVADWASQAPVTGERRRWIISHLADVSFGVGLTEAQSSIGRMRRRELEDLKAHVQLLAESTLETTAHCAGWYVCNWLSTLSFGAQKALLAKAAAAGAKLKFVLVPAGAVGGAAGAVSGLVAASSATSAALWGVMATVDAARAARVLWRDRFELTREPLRDAAIVGVIVALNAQPAVAAGRNERDAAVEVIHG